MKSNPSPSSRCTWEVQWKKRAWGNSDWYWFIALIGYTKLHIGLKMNTHKYWIQSNNGAKMQLEKYNNIQIHIYFYHLEKSVSQTYGSKPTRFLSIIALNALRYFLFLKQI